MKQFLTILFSLLLMATSANAQLTGQFSVSASKQVYFSKGNLRYHCSSKAWSFATNQYDVVGQSNSNISSSYAGYIDLFGWGTSGNNNLMPYETSLSVVYGGGYNSIANTAYDWGSKVSGDYRTLTQNEWTYLLTERNNAYLLRGPATVNGVNGWILLPDNWSKPASITFTSFDDGARAYTANVYTASEFSTMQTAGAVFLPATGYRYSSGSISVVSGVASMGYYWSANKANVSFMGNYMYCNSEMDSYMGLAVRLVTETLSSSSSGGGGSSQQKCTVTTVVEPTGAGNVYGGGTYNANTYVTIRATPNEGWEFAYFSSTHTSSDTYSTPWTFRLGNQNVTVTAHFRPIQYCIYSNSSNSGQGTTEPERVCGPIGSRVTFRAIPKTGCRFKRWTDGNTNATRTFTIQSPDDNDTYLWAEFESVENYTVTATSAQPQMGSIVRGTGTFGAGTRVQLEAKPNHTYKFLHWNNNPSQTSNPKYFYLYGDSTYTAYFGPASTVSLDLQVDNQANGTVTGAGTYYEQESVTIEAQPTRGKKFVQWLKCTQNDNGETTETFFAIQNPYTFTIRQNTTIKAVFEDSPEYTVTLQTDDAANGTFRYYPQKETYLYGDSITLEATPDPCYRLLHWKIMDQKGYTLNTYSSNPQKIAVTSDMIISATFQQMQTSFSLGTTRVYGYGSVNINVDGVDQGGSYTGCPGEIITLSATPQDGYFFDHWEDGNTDNPRQFALPATPDNYTRVHMYAIFNRYRTEGYCGTPVLEDVSFTIDMYYGMNLHGSGAVKKYTTQTRSLVINTSYDTEQATTTGAPWTYLCPSYLVGDDSASYVCVHDSITELPSYSFLTCRKPRKLFIKSVNFRKLGYGCFESCKNLHYIELGDSLQEIDNNAFMNCNLNEVILPASLKKIGSSAFSYNSNLHRIIFCGATPPTITSGKPFSNIGTDTIFVPTGSRQAYINAGYKDGTYIKHVIEWHRVNTEVVGNGTCSYDAKQLICAGDTVTLHVTPEGGNIIHSIIVTDGAGNTIPLTQDYRFEMPENDVTVRVVFVNANDYTPIHLTTRQLNTTSAVLAFAWETNEPVHMFDFFIRYNDEIVYSGITSTPSISISTMETPVPGTYQYTWGVRSRDELGGPIGEWAYSEATLEIQGTQGIETIKINGEDASGKPVKLLWNNQIYIIRGDKIYSITGQLVK